MVALGPLQTVLMIGLLTLLPSVLGGVTIKRDALFENTLEKWNVKIRNKRDYSERLARFERAVESVERTTSGVVLENLNSFTVMNDKEWENRVLPLLERGSTTLFNEDVAPVAYANVKKRSTEQPDRELPKEFNYWEEEVGLNPSRDQMDCGACWSFPDVGTMEALNTQLTGDRTEFSQQYFVDCTYPYSGCAGGTVNAGYRVTMMRQYIVSYEDHPFTANYNVCKFTDDIANMRNNAMNKIWIQTYWPVKRSELGLMEGLLCSPVTMGMFISEDLFAYSGGRFVDHSCATAAMAHAMLLVGYTETTLRVKASYGPDFGEGGYINYLRGSPSLANCRFFNNAFALLATVRRDLDYEYCNDRRPTTRQGCRDSCLAMNTDTVSGWDLAVIPTRYHNDHITRHLESDFPGRQNALWIGLVGSNEDFTEYEWVDGFTPANYVNMTRDGMGRRYALIQQQDGQWITRGSETFEARGICSRAINCWNIENAVKDGLVTFNNPDRSEGTIATVKCTNGGNVVGASRLKCVGGLWDSDLPTCSAPEPEPAPAQLQSVDGGWSDYGDWSTCSVQCDEGTQSRSRSCNNPVPANGGGDCQGDTEETRSCNTDPCQEDRTESQDEEGRRRGGRRRGRQDNEGNEDTIGTETNSGNRRRKDRGENQEIEDTENATEKNAREERKKEREERRRANNDEN